MPMATEVIAIANHKGGVGKSTTAVSVAVGLARTGRRVLIVDCDAQANATTLMLPGEDVKYDLHDLIVDDVKLDQVIVATRVAGLDMIPSTLQTALLDRKLISMYRSEDQIRTHLEPIEGQYHVIVLDLPPSLGYVVIGALCAATSLVVPTDPAKWGVDAVFAFTEWTQEMRKAKVMTADLLGVLITRDEPRTNASKTAKDRVKAAGMPLFKTFIPKRTAVNQMAEDSMVIGDLLSDNDMTSAYMQFVVELLARIDEVQGQRGRHAGG
jgi:chromosome partitioning protein